MINNLYEDKISGIISQDTFFMLIKKYEKQKKEIEEKINECKIIEERTLSSDKFNQEHFESLMKKVLSFDEITEENKSLMFKLIDKIIINDKNIKIKYKFNNIKK